MELRSSWPGISLYNLGRDVHFNLALIMWQFDLSKTQFWDTGEYVFLDLVWKRYSYKYMWLLEQLLKISTYAYIKGLHKI